MSAFEMLKLRLSFESMTTVVRCMVWSNLIPKIHGLEELDPKYISWYL